MGKSFYDDMPSVRRLFEEASDVTGKDLQALCFEGPDTTLVQTDNVQPAITLVSLACLQVLREADVNPSVAAGHSVGEYAALSAAGALSFGDTMRLVQVRGSAMRAEAERYPGTMAAIFGLSPDVLAEICAEAGGGAVQLGNHNPKTQSVVTSTTEGVQAVGKTAKARGAKLVVPLKVSGPWHSQFMAGARTPARVPSALRRRLTESTIANVSRALRKRSESIRRRSLRKSGRFSEVASPRGCGLHLRRGGRAACLADCSSFRPKSVCSTCRTPTASQVPGRRIAELICRLKRSLTFGARLRRSRSLLPSPSTVRRTARWAKGRASNCAGPNIHTRPG